MAKPNVSINDLDEATSNFEDFLKAEVRLPGSDQGSVISTLLTPLRFKLDLADRHQISDIYDSLIAAWISPLSRNVPNRTRIALEKLLRNLAGQLCLASYAMIPDSAEENENEWPDKPSTTATFTLPVRRRASVPNIKKSKEAEFKSSPPMTSSQIFADVGFLPSSPLRAPSTPGLAPSLPPQSPATSFAEDPASQRLRAYAALPLQSALPIKLSNLLDHWQVGVDPASYSWEAAQQAFASDDEEEEELEAHAKKRERAEKLRKRRRELEHGPSSQRPPKRVGGSQPQEIHTDVLASSQATESMVTASQAEPGRFGGQSRKVKKKKSFGLRPAGFK